MFDEFLQHEVTRLNLPGLAVVVNEVIDHGIREVYAGGIGYRDAAYSEPVTPDTLFGVASVTKMLTAVAILRLAEQGQLTIDDPVAQHLPELQIAHKSAIKLRHLLSHSAGIPGLGSRFHAINLDSAASVNDSRLASQSKGLLNTNDLIDYLNSVDLQLIADPGKILNYSNESFCLLGGIIEQQRSQPYPSAIHTDILQRLQLKRSFFTANSLTDKSNIAYPLIRNENTFRQQAFWDAPLFYSAGGWVTSARDAAKLIGGIFSNPQFLSADSRLLLSAMALPVPSRPQCCLGYSFGLEYRQIDSNNTIMWHTGQRPGVSSFVAWHLEQKIALSVLSNVADVPVASIGYDVLGQLLQRHDFAWPPVHTRSALMSSSSKHYDGRYLSDEGFDFQIQTNDGITRLYTHRPDRSVPFDGAARQQTGSRLEFRDQSSGTVGAHTFCFLPEANLQTGMANGCSSGSAGLAIDLRIIPRFG